MSDQTTAGDSVVVAAASLPDGGFLSIHDETLLDGATFDSIVGSTAYLSPGTHDDIDVSVDITDSGQFIAIPFQDTNGNERYDFVTSDGADDGPYTTDEGDIVLDTAQVTVEEVASVSFPDQMPAGRRVTIDRVVLPNGGFVSVHESGPSQPRDRYRGASSYLSPGISTGVEVNVGTVRSGTYYAYPIEDADGDGRSDFDEGGDTVYTDLSDDPVFDTATVTPDRTASVTFRDQSVDAGTVTVAEARLSAGGFVVILDPDTDGFEPPLPELDPATLRTAIVGASDYLAPGRSRDLSIPVLTGRSGAYLAIPFFDADGSRSFDLGTASSSRDVPYTAEGRAVSDTAILTVATPTATPAAPASETPTDTPLGGSGADLDEVDLPSTPTPGVGGPASGSGPGFGADGAVAAILGAGLVRWWRQHRGDTSE